jgi:murein DD-endopeptidase MepM/ murein hydrolase activator NlpD
MGVLKFGQSITLLFLVIVFIGCGAKKQAEAEAERLENEMEELMAEEVSLRYGLDETGYTVETNTIKPNQFLAEILLPLGVSYPEIARLEEVANHVFPLNKLRANDTYVTFCTSDTSQTLHYFVVETGKADYVVYQFRDSIYAYKGQKPIETRLRKASGVINSSLNATILDQDLPASLAHDLSSMYAWTVDFYRIQKGDYFRVIFEEQFVDGKSIGVGNILAAEFNHRERSFQGFYFEAGDQASYFDEKAESLRKAFLKAPLEYSRISSRYTMKRYHPVQKRWKAHLGTDYAAPTGTPIMATGDGTVIESSYGKYNGNYVKIRHNGMYTTQYLHMSKRLVKKGQVVKQGEIIGKVGATGLASGPHVCYRFWKDGKQVDPYKQDLPPSDPVDKAYLGDFYTHRDTLAELLQAIPVQNQTEELP